MATKTTKPTASAAAKTAYAVAAAQAPKWAAADPAASLTVRAAVTTVVIAIGGLFGVNATDGAELAQAAITTATAVGVAAGGAGVIVGYFRRRFSQH